MDEENQSDDSQKIDVSVNSSPEPVESSAPEAVPPTQDQPVNQPTSSPIQEKPKKSKKWLIILLLVLILAGGGFLFWKASQDNVQEAPIASQGEAQQEELAEETTLPKLTNIVYAHADSEGAEKQLYSRPATGGERTETGFSFPADIQNSSYSPNSNKYIAISGNNIYLGEGSGEPKIIYTEESGREITSAKISPDGDSVAISITGNINSDRSMIADRAKIITFDSDGSNVEEFYINENDSPAVYVFAWDNESKTAYFRLGCYACDGFNGDIYKVSQNESAVEVLAKGGYSSTVVSSAINSDLTKIAYIEGTQYTDEQMEQYSIQQFLGIATGAPHSLSVIDLATGETETLVESFGSIEDYSNGNYPSVNVSWSKTIDSEKPAYSYKNQLFTINPDGSESMLFESGQGEISMILFASDKEVLTGATKQNDDSSISTLVNYFNIEEQKATTVMEADYSNTRLLLIGQE